jgi:Winged helix DNA-binding domain
MVPMARTRELGQDLAHRRLRNLRLEGPPLASPAEVVGWLGAVQSQDYGPAKWSVAARTSGVGDADLDQAFADGTILRTHVLRPTWHFVLPADIRWLLELTAPRVHALNAYSYRQLGLDDAVRERAATLLAAALRGGNQLTRRELGEVLRAGGIAASGFRLAYLLAHAELERVVCSGARNGRQHTYALLEERAPQAASRAREEALAELTLRYFTSHGPATAKDFRWWSSLTAADVAEGLALVGSRLQAETVDGVTYWSAAAAPPRRAAASPTVHLLQGYDEYVVGYSESKWVLDLDGTARSRSQARALANGVVVRDGQVAGHWRRLLPGRSVAVEVALYEPLDDAASRSLEAAAARHAEFLGLPATLATTVL